MLFWMLVSSIVAALAGLLIYVYYLKRGQFDDMESIKYQLFREDNPDS
jgi:cbb3-type cytochrome oxidase maturation protein